MGSKPRMSYNRSYGVANMLMGRFPQLQPTIMHRATWDTDEAACDPTLKLEHMTLGRIINWDVVRYCKRCEACEPLLFRVTRPKQLGWVWV